MNNHTGEPFLSVEMVTKSFRIAANRIDVLKGVSFTAGRGEWIALTGASGSGKTTLLDIIGTISRPDSGRVLIDGTDTTALAPRKNVVFRRKKIGFVFQNFMLIDSMTVYDNVAFVLRCIDAPTKYIRKRVPQVIGLLGLQDKANRYPGQLSGGEQQRVALARALVNNPQLIIADEPTGNLDPRTSVEIVKLLKEINDRGTTVLMVTHEHELVKRMGGRLINIRKGEISFDDRI